MALGSRYLGGGFLGGEVAVAGDVTVTPGAATAIGATLAPTVLVTVSATAALAAGATMAPQILVVVFPVSAAALGITPGPTVIGGDQIIVIGGTDWAAIIVSNW